MYISRTSLAEILQKVQLYLSLYRFDAAEKLLKSTLENYGENAVIYHQLGLTYHKQSRFPEALDEFTRAIKANPNFIEPILNLAATLCDLSKYEEAHEIFSLIHELQEEANPIPKLIVGRIANYHAKIGRLYEKTGMRLEAIEEYRRAKDLFPKMPDVSLALAKLYVEENKLQLAMEELDRLLETEPTFNEARNLLGVIYLKRGQSDRARQTWLEATNFDPQDQIAHAYLRISANV
jgi:tetratricopeptide (TPR) repeat protein